MDNQIPFSVHDCLIDHSYSPNLLINCIFFYRNSSVVFAFQMPLARGGIILDYSRWMANLLTIIQPEIVYPQYITNPGKDAYINGTVTMKVRVGVKNIGDTAWKEYLKKDNLKRTFNCFLPAAEVKYFSNHQ